MSALTKEKIESFRAFVNIRHGISSQSADRMLLEAIQLLYPGSLLADWELRDLLRDIKNGRDIENSYNWLNSEAAFILQCPDVYEIMEDVKSNKAGLRYAADLKYEAMEDSNAAIELAPETPLTGEVPNED